MAKPLTTSPPTSSIVRFFDVSATTRAIAGKHEISNGHEGLQAERTFTRSNVPRDVPRVVKREVSLCAATNRTLETLVHGMRSSTGMPITASHVVRALLRVVEPVTAFAKPLVASGGPWRMPATAPSARQDRANFDERLARVLAEALRSGPTATA